MQLPPPYLDAERAVYWLRCQLRLLTSDDSTAPDSATLRMAVPDAVVGRHGVVSYEWTAAVEAHG